MSLYIQPKIFKVQKTLLAVRADSKTDHSVSMAEVDSVATKCRILAYQTRALKQVILSEPTEVSESKCDCSITVTNCDEVNAR